MRRQHSLKTKKAREYSSRTQSRTASLRPCSCRPTRCVRNIAHYGKDAYTTTQKCTVCRHTRPLGRLSTVRSLTRSCTCDNGEGSLTMQPPPTLHMGLHLTHEWHVASPQKRPLCTLSRHLFFLRKPE